MKNILLITLSFVLGSIPFGIIIAKARGVDLKKVGSGNIGATNVLRSLGKGPAVFTLLGDVFKGSLAVATGKYFGLGPVSLGLAGIAAILGHNFSLFLGFKGGKGVATSIGVLLVYTPAVAVFTVLIWLVVVFLTKYSSLGAIVAFALLPVNIIFFDFTDKTKLVIAIAISFLILGRHNDNVRRLIKGTEKKIGQRI
jgi:glycerol-3-phosphate acyltransferase PlsY